jgi:anti-anti-sigma factor
LVDSEALTVTRYDDADAVVLRVAGEIDGFTASPLRDAIDGVLSEAATGRTGQRVVLELTAVEFFNSSGVPVLTGAAEQARRHGVTLQIVRPPNGRVARTLDITGVSHLLPIAPGPP